MSRCSTARAARRECARHGHLPKTDGAGRWYCARCSVDLPAQLPLVGGYRGSGSAESMGQPPKVPPAPRSPG